MVSYSHSGQRKSGGVWKAAIVAVLFLLLSDRGYRYAAARYAQVGRSVPLPAGTLAQLPMRIGDWTGQEVPLDADVIRGTDTDDRVNRLYRRGTDDVSFYVAYGVRIRDLAPHRPEVCYVGSGWVLEHHRELNLQTTDGAVLPVQIQRFSRGELDKQHVTVLNYYIVNGIYSADVSGLRREAMRRIVTIPMPRRCRSHQAGHRTKRVNCWSGLLPRSQPRWSTTCSRGQSTLQRTQTRPAGPD